MLLSSPLRRLLTAVVGLLVLVAAACGGGNGLAAEDATLVNQFRVANGIAPLPRSSTNGVRFLRASALISAEEGDSTKPLIKKLLR